MSSRNDPDPARVPRADPLGHHEHALLATFFTEVPEEDRAFFKDDVADPRVVARLAGVGVVRVVRDEDGDLLAFGSLAPGLARSAHVADLRVVVSARARRQGLGRMLLQCLLLEAVQHGFLKVTVDVPADHQAALDLVRQLGFEPEALLRGHLRDGEGRLRDVVVLAHRVDEQWQGMVAAGVRGELQ